MLHLPREPGYREKPRKKNGPALAGYGAVTMKNALVQSMTALPDQLCRSLTWDRGKELSAHADLTVETDRLLRQCFPKGTNLSRWSAEQIEAVAATLNSRPRKVLDWKTPADALDEHLRSLQKPGVASTG